MTLSVLYADDELPARQKLKRLLSAYPDITTLYEASQGLEVLNYVQNKHIDVLLLDINMPNVSGLEVAHALMEHSHIPFIVFVTAFDQHAISAFELNACDYLLKPYTQTRLYQALDRIKQRMQQQLSPSPATLKSILDDLTRQTPCQRLLVRQKDAFIVVLTSDILRIESQGNYVHLHTPTGQYLHRMTMNQCSDILGHGFCRVHRSSIVNLNAITRVEPLFKGDYALFLSNGDELKLSRRYKEHFFRQFERSLN